jgi:hypothetical protein
MIQAVSQLQGMQPKIPEPDATAAERRIESNRRRNQQQESAAQSKQFKTFADVTETFGGDTVRIRVLSENRSLATAVVERDKFVESLDRLVLRHGYLTGGKWRVIGQVNAAGGEDFYQAEGTNFLDLLEKGGVAALQQMTSLSVGTVAGWTLTPLAIYRAIPGPRSG